MGGHPSGAVMVEGSGFYGSGLGFRRFIRVKDLHI